MQKLRLGRYRGKCAAIWTEDGRTKRAAIGGRQCGHSPSCQGGPTNCQVAKTAFAEFQRLIEIERQPVDMTSGGLMDAYADALNADGKDGDRVKYAVKAWRGQDMGHLMPHQITEDHCKQYAAARLADGRSKSTIWKELNTLSSALSWAKKKGWIGEAPFIWRPEQAPPRDRWLTRAEANRLIKAAHAPHVRLFITLALTTAGRTSAILGLTWSRVDMENGRINLNDTDIVTAANKGRARVPINKTAMAALTVARKAAMTRFVIEFGGDRVKSIRKGFEAACARAKLKGVTPHTLRHTAATWMAQDGVDMRRIAGYLGHTSTATTERIYAHHHPDYLKDAANALEL